jgi:hypothetical protein
MFENWAYEKRIAPKVYTFITQTLSVSSLRLPFNHLSSIPLFSHASPLAVAKRAFDLELRSMSHLSLSLGACP